MLSRTAFRVSPMAQMAARRGFSTTKTQMSSPYHYPEGPRNNLPFNPMTKYFAFRFWGFMGTSLPSAKPGQATSFSRAPNNLEPSARQRAASQGDN